MATPSVPPSAATAQRKSTRRPSDGAAFIAACLAPLPGHSDPVAARRLRIDQRNIDKKRWQAGMMRVWMSMHAYKALEYLGCYVRLYADPERSDDPGARHAAQERYRAEVRCQMLVPAVRHTDLRWKLSQIGFTGTSPEIEAAIAADEARLLKREG